MTHAPRVLAVALAVSSGCVPHAQGTTPVVPAAPVCPTVAASPVSVAAAVPTQQHEFSWQLETRGAAQQLADELHAFSVGRWECALGAEQPDDRRAEGVHTTVRTRRAACTHGSGATVQTQLRCQYDELANAQIGAGELELTLDTAPPLRVSCTPRIAP